jgi:DNA-directed RNA polymerase subunit H
LVEEFDVGKHVLVPKHEVLSPEKTKEVLEKFKVTYRDLPLVKASDPAVKAVGAKAGDVLKITRDSQTAGKAILYKFVVED